MLSTAEKAQYLRDRFFVERAFYAPDEAEAINRAFMEASKDGPVARVSDAVKALGPDDPLARFPRMINPYRHTDKEVGGVALTFMLDPRLERPL